MKALTLHQPWATWVVEGVKHVETRSWRTTYSGWIAIHSSLLGRFCTEHELERYERRGGFADGALSSLAYIHGHILGVVQVFGCQPVEELAGVLTRRERLLGDYSPGRWAWRLGVSLSFVTTYPCRGYQGLWTVPKDLEGKLMRQILPQSRFA